MKKILLLIAVASLISACGGGGGGDGGGSVAGTPAGPVPAGQGDAFVSAVLAVTNLADADKLDTDGPSGSIATYNSVEATTPETTIPDTLV